VSTLYIDAVISGFFGVLTAGVGYFFERVRQRLEEHEALIVALDARIDELEGDD